MGLMNNTHTHTQHRSCTQASSLRARHAQMQQQAITTPSLHHHCTITAPSLDHHCDITAPSLRQSGRNIIECGKFSLSSSQPAHVEVCSAHMTHASSAYMPHASNTFCICVQCILHMRPWHKHRHHHATITPPSLPHHCPLEAPFFNEPSYERQQGTIAAPSLRHH